MSSPTTTDERYISKSSLPGFMGLMQSENIDILLSCLDLAYRTSLLFDSRLGLKFLIQKVAGLERAANLYRQAGAAWTIKAVVLFEICLAYVMDKKLSVEDIKRLLDKTEEEEKENDVGKFLKKLRQNFNDLCTTYIDVILEAEGTQDNLEKADQPIFFLIACQDEEIPEVKKSNKVAEGEAEAAEETSKPFFLSDFTRADDDDTSNYESDSQECINQCGENDAEAEEKEKEEGEEKDGEKNADREELDDPERIAEVLNEFKKSKKQKTRMSKQTRLNPFNVPRPPQPSVPPEIEIQRRKSFIKVSNHNDVQVRSS